MITHCHVVVLWFGLKICWYDEYRPSVPLNQRVHHRTERACSWIETVYCFSVYTYRSESYIGLCLSFEPLRQIQRSNIAYRTGGSVGQRFWTELIMNQCVYPSNHWFSSVQKHCPTEPSVRYAIFECWICPSGSNDKHSPMYNFHWLRYV